MNDHCLRFSQSTSAFACISAASTLACDAAHHGPNIDLYFGQRRSSCDIIKVYASLASPNMPNCNLLKDEGCIAPTLFVHKYILSGTSPEYDGSPSSSSCPRVCQKSHRIWLAPSVVAMHEVIKPMERHFLHSSSKKSKQRFALWDEAIIFCQEAR